ncbi:hypothetical protein WI560_17365 [Bradyrhizobium sp. A11]|uniref:hypothetical protein n=1 Tax=Bradyrhizobium sp. A11 TaxID=3133974 RepID=UPI0032546E2F
MKLSARMVSSPNSVAGGAPFVVVKLITMGGFARDAPKAQNGFILPENCFVGSEATTQFSKTANHFRQVAPELKAACQVPHSAHERVLRRRRHDPALRASHAFYVFLLKRRDERRLGRRTERASAATQAIETETPGSPGAFS